MYAFEDYISDVEKILERKIDSNISDFEMKSLDIELSHESALESLKFSDNRIHYKMKDGTLVHGYLIMNRNSRGAFWDYQLKRKSSLPKFHTTECKKIHEMKMAQHFNGTYIFSNVPKMMLECDEGGGMLDDPRVCGYCAGINSLDKALRTTGYCESYVEKVSDVGKFRKGQLPTVKVVDLEGYPDNWSKKSRNYREKMNYICEECNVDLKHATYYLETHHINGNKTDDVYSNLKCLCIKCHSEVDEYHKRNYSAGKNKEKLDDFMKLFHKQFN